MPTTQEVYDVLIIGAGPAGLSSAIAAQEARLSYLVIEKGCLVNSIYHFPTNIILFSTPELLEIGDIPFIISTEKPNGSDLLKYYRRVTEHFDLNINLFEKVTTLSEEKNKFHVNTNKSKYTTKYIVLATGQFDTPKLIGIPGEDLPMVSHYYRDGHPFYRKKVAVIGGKNSAVEAALDLYKHSADVNLIHRGPTFGSSVKYWILPDIENRIKEKKIEAFFSTTVTKITEKHITIKNGNGQSTNLACDHVFALTGYIPARDLLRNIGIEFDENLTPIHDAKTLESNVRGVYIAGVLTAGSAGSKVFIENSRHHGTKIVRHILNGSK